MDKSTNATTDETDSDTLALQNENAIKLADEGHEAQAEDQLRRAATAGYGPAMYNLGLLLERLGRTDEAAEAYLASTTLGEIDGHAKLARLLSDIVGDLEGAERHLQLGGAAGDTDAMVNLGLLYEKSGRDAEAEPLYRAAIASGDRAAYWALGGVLEALGRDAEAEDAYRSAIVAGEENASVDLAQFLADRGRDTEAEQVFHEAVQRSVHRASLYFGQFLAEQPGREVEAEEMYRRALAEGDTDAHNGLAALFEKTGRVGDAEAEYKKSIEVGDEQAHLYLADLYEDQGDLEKAEQQRQSADTVRGSADDA